MTKNKKSVQVKEVLIAGRKVKVATAEEVKAVTEKVKKKLARALENLKNR